MQPSKGTYPHRPELPPVYCTPVGLSLTGLVHAAQGPLDTDHALFVMTNSAESNEIISYERNSYGTLLGPQSRVGIEVCRRVRRITTYNRSAAAAMPMGITTRSISC